MARVDTTSIALSTFVGAPELVTIGSAPCRRVLPNLLTTIENVRIVVTTCRSYVLKIVHVYCVYVVSKCQTHHSYTLIIKK